MFFKLFLAFTIIPVLELYILIEIGSYLGALNTIMVVIVTGFVGAYLARLQGFQTMLRVRERLNHGEMPTEGLIDALLILLAGIVLLTPGFLTDIAGLLILIPQTRNRFKGWLMWKLENWIHNNRVDIQFYR
ncbi:FxsA family protein [Thermodesulfobacteriota bacterium]